MTINLLKEGYNAGNLPAPEDSSLGDYLVGALLLIGVILITIWQFTKNYLVLSTLNWPGVFVEHER